MVFPHEHLLIRFHGHFGGSTTPADRWSSGVRMGLGASAPAYDVGKLQTLVNACQTAANILHATAAVAAGTNTWLTHVTGAQIGVNGKYLPTNQLTVISPTIPTAGSSSPVQEWTAAGVISLRTANPRGPASNGRVYWPWIGASPGASTGRIDASTVAARVAAFKTFFDSLNAAANTYSAGMRVVVASNVGGGLIAPVTAIRSDGRLDNIERRENDLPVTWSVAALS